MSLPVFSVICMGVFGLLLVRWNRQDKIGLSNPPAVVMNSAGGQGREKASTSLKTRAPFST